MQASCEQAPCMSQFFKAKLRNQVRDVRSVDAHEVRMLVLLMADAARRDVHFCKQSNSSAIENTISIESERFVFIRPVIAPQLPLWYTDQYSGFYTSSVLQEYSTLKSSRF